MVSNQYTRSKYNSCVYYKGVSEGKAVYLLLYVDDMLIANVHKSEIQQLKGLLDKEF